MAYFSVQTLPLPAHADPNVAEPLSPPFSPPGKNKTNKKPQTQHFHVYCCFQVKCFQVKTFENEIISRTAFKNKMNIGFSWIPFCLFVCFLVFFYFNLFYIIEFLLFCNCHTNTNITWIGNMLHVSWGLMHGGRERETKKKESMTSV